MTRLFVSCALAASLCACGQGGRGQGLTPQETPDGPGAPVAETATPACTAGELALSDQGGDAGVGNRVLIVGVTNAGDGACVLDGYPAVAVLDARGAILASVRSEQNPDSYFRQAQAPEPVGLAPGAMAFFDVAWNVVPHEDEGEKSCPAASQLRVGLPGDTGSVVLAQEFTPCGHRVRISPFRRVAEPAN